MEELKEYTWHNISDIPEKLLGISASALYSLFPSPTLIKINGKNSKPILISILLHGNEKSGFYGMQRLLKEIKYGYSKLKNSVYIFIGNTEACRNNLRKMPAEPDFNRIWTGSEGTNLDSLVNYLIKKMKNEKIIAAIDIHNNTGKNPHYSCLAQLTPNTLKFAKLFSNRAIHILKPESSHVVCFSKFTTSLTLECGDGKDKKGNLLAYNFLKKLLIDLPTNGCPDKSDSFILYENEAKISIPNDSSFSFVLSKGYDFNINSNIEDLNFTTLKKDTLIGYRNNFKELEVTSTQEEENDDFLFYRKNEIYLREGMIPSMLTCDIQNIKDDCLCYLMQPIVL